MSEHIGASYFNNAHNFSIANLTINTPPERPRQRKRLSRTPLECESHELTPCLSHLADELNDILSFLASSPGVDLLDNMADGAMHNSAERSDAPKCHEDTRVAVQDEILSWVRHGERDANPKNVMWLTGPAGSGKTAIAGSVAEVCEREGLLAASFFFSTSSRSANRRSKRCLVATLAYQLLQHPALQYAGQQMLDCIARDPSIFKKRMEDQMKALVLEPLADARESFDTNDWPKVIIIDGLDECEVEEFLDRMSTDAQRTQEDDHLEILQLLLSATQHPAFAFRVIVASRPEPVISTFFSSPNIHHVAANLFLDQKYDPDSDIALFFRAKFAELRRRHNIWDWPTEDVIRMLVERASGQFIYAATVVRFMEGRTNKNRRRSSSSPQAQLECVLRSRALAEDGTSPLAPLDFLYMCILRTSADPTLAVKWIRLIDSMLRGHPATFVRQFLEASPGEAEGLLGSLSSLVFSPPANGESAFMPYHFYHKSLMDFLDDPARCGELYVASIELDELYRKQYYNVLQAKNTQSPIPFRERSMFLERFFNWLDHVPATLTHTEFVASEKALLACDVVWCVQASYDAARIKEKRRFAFLFFESVHAHCHWYKCNSVCKHWRSNIAKACKAQGWKLPRASRVGLN